jgi:rhamnogalacturonan endolyase
MVVLAKPGGDLYSQGTDYIFYSKADSSGAFSIPHVRPGTYSLYAFATGGSIGDITDQFEKDNVKVEGSHTDVGPLTWSPPHYSQLLWQIGSADRKVTEFKLGNLPRQYGLNKKVAPTLTYTIGKSKPSDDWYYAQTQAGNWTVDFHLDKSYSGNAHLTVATAGQARKATVEVVVNGHVIETLPSYTNDASIYRSANPSGYYHLAVLNFPASHLKTGANSLTLHATHVDDGGGKMYDTVKLEVE